MFMEEGCYLEERKVGKAQYLEEKVCFVQTFTFTTFISWNSHIRCECICQVKRLESNFIVKSILVWVEFDQGQWYHQKTDFSEFQKKKNPITKICSLEEFGSKIKALQVPDQHPDNAINQFLSFCPILKKKRGFFELEN